MRTRREEGKMGRETESRGWSPKFMRCSKMNAKKEKTEKKTGEMRVVKIHAGGKRRGKQKLVEGGKKGRNEWRREMPGGD